VSLRSLKLLLCATASVLLVSAAKAQGQSPAEKLGWQLAVHSYTFKEYPIFDAIDKTAALGVKYMSISGGLILDGTNKLLTVNLTDKERERIDKKLKADGFGHFVNIGVVQLSADEAKSRKVFEFARKWGIGMLVAEPPLDSLDTVEKLCKEYNIKVAIHEHSKGHSIYWKPEILLDAIKGRSPLMGACADIGHYMKSGLDPVECIKKLEGHILCLHFKDLNGMDMNAHDVPWGTGVGKSKQLMEELKRQHYRGVFCIEYEHDWTNSMPELAQCVKFWNDTCAELAATPAK
jgi:sugar phosphate isomerase/epimerase